MLRIHPRADRSADGAPKASSQDPANEAAAMVEVRQQLGDKQGLPDDNWLVIGDALADTLGMVYLPTGNATPDYWGSHRSAACLRYAGAPLTVVNPP